MTCLALVKRRLYKNDLHGNISKAPKMVLSKVWQDRYPWLQPKCSLGVRSFSYFFFFCFFGKFLVHVWVGVEVCQMKHTLYWFIGGLIHVGTPRGAKMSFTLNEMRFILKSMKLTRPMNRYRMFFLQTSIPTSNKLLKPIELHEIFCKQNKPTSN